MDHTVVARTPNIIVIMADDMRWDDLPAMPNVRRLLADQGVSFSNSFVNFSLCCSSRASFLTGEAAHNHGILGNTVATQGGAWKFKAQDSNTLPVWLQRAGYQTGIIGKYLNGYGYNADSTTYDTASVGYRAPGWDDWEVMPDPLGTYNYYNYAINDNGVIKKFGSTPAEYQIDVLGQRMINFVDAASGSKPFFLWFTPLAPHVGGGSEDPVFPEGPVPAPRNKGMYQSLALPQPQNFNETDVTDKPVFMQSLPLIDTSNLAFVTNTFRNRRETLFGLDEWVGTLVNTLKKEGKLDSTIIVFTSDNGWSQGEHRRTRGKQVVYEESIRVPLIIRGPGIPAGQTRTQYVNNLDLVATIVEAAHASAGHPSDGHTLSSLLSDANTTWRTGLLVEGMDVSYMTQDDSKRFMAVRTPNYVYVEHTTGEKELYDLLQDSAELTNVIGNPVYANAVSAFAGELTHLRGCVGQTCWTTLPEPTKIVLQTPTVSLIQSSSQTTSDSVNASSSQPFTVSWTSTNATTCTLQKRSPDGTLFNPLNGALGVGASGSQENHPPLVGVHHYWIDCAGPGGTVHQEMDHTVVLQ
jgi:arylsulfatase A-like enzyme